MLANVVPRFARRLDETDCPARGTIFLNEHTSGAHSCFRKSDEKLHMTTRLRPEGHGRMLAPSDAMITIAARLHASRAVVCLEDTNLCQYVF